VWQLATLTLLLVARESISWRTVLASLPMWQAVFKEQSFPLRAAKITIRVKILVMLLACSRGAVMAVHALTSIQNSYRRSHTKVCQKQNKYISIALNTYSSTLLALLVFYFNNKNFLNI
jgi:hypothetical protein